MEKRDSHKAIAITLAGVAAVVFGMGFHRAAMPLPQAAAPQIPIAVNIVQPKRQDIAHRLQINATVEAFESADLYAKVSGYVSAVNVDIGDRVTAHQTLTTISVPELEQELAEAKAQLQAKRAVLALQQATLKRQDVLLKEQGTTDQAYDEIRGKTDVASAEVDVAAAAVDKIETLLAYTRVVAPFSGVVARRLINRGDFVQAASGARTTPLLTVQRIDTMRVFCDVPEGEVSRLKVGDPATVKPFGLNGKAFSGAVTRLSRRLDPETRNMRTEIDLPNPDEMLYPGMYAQVVLETERHPNVLTLPASAVISDDSGSFVYLVNEGRIARQSIRTGMIEAGIVEVSDGVPENAQVMAMAKSAPSVGTEVTVAHRDAR
jgi:RND family efflux transporter MFP subunit